MRKITFNKFSGLRIKGVQSVSRNMDRHIDLASLITEKIESGGLFGTVINYDGTGMTAGIHQAVAVFPRALNSQGPLWKTLARMVQLPESPISLINILEEMFDFGIYLALDGVVRYRVNGKQVTGGALRRFFGTPDGQLAKGLVRDRAERLIKLFHELFSDESTYKLQLALGEKHFLNLSERTKLRFSRIPRTKGSTIQRVIYDTLTGTHLSILRCDEIDDELNLAMCLYWSYLVNAPGMALKKMCKTLDAIDRRTNNWGSQFSRLLVFNLGTSSYGRWDDDIDNGRYRRTRKEMMKHFDKKLFRKGAIMPKDFPGA